MPHPLENEYALTADELLDAINRRFRAKVTLEGAVAEVHLGKKIKVLQDRGVIERFESHDSDGYPDYTIWLPGQSDGQLIECKNIRNSDEAFRQGGVDVAYKVETQKTRTSNNDPSSRFYEAGHFAILAVCMGKKTHCWTDFRFIRVSHLARHSKYPTRLAVMHRVPISDAETTPPWYCQLDELLRGEPR